MNYGTLFSVLEAGGPRSGGRARSGSRILPVSSRGGERQGSPGRFYRGVTLLTRAPRGLPTEHHFWGQDFSINVGGGDTGRSAIRGGAETTDTSDVTTCGKGRTERPSTTDALKDV